MYMMDDVFSCSTVRSHQKKRLIFHASCATLGAMVFLDFDLKEISFRYAPASQLLPTKHGGNSLVELSESMCVMNALRMVNSILYFHVLLILQTSLF